MLGAVTLRGNDGNFFYVDTRKNKADQKASVNYAKQWEIRRRRQKSRRGPRGTHGSSFAHEDYLLPEHKEYAHVRLVQVPFKAHQIAHEQKREDILHVRKNDLKSQNLTISLPDKAPKQRLDPAVRKAMRQGFLERNARYEQNRNERNAAATGKPKRRKPKSGRNKNNKSLSSASGRARRYRKVHGKSAPTGVTPSPPGEGKHSTESKETSTSIPQSTSGTATAAATSSPQLPSVESRGPAIQESIEVEEAVLSEPTVRTEVPQGVVEEIVDETEI